MDYRRLNISQLSREFKTHKRTIYDWINKGYLKPVQIIGNQRKFTVADFLRAERKALKDAQYLFHHKSNSKKIPADFYNNIENYI